MGEKRIKEVQDSCLSLSGTLLKVNAFLMFKNLRGTVFDSGSIYTIQFYSRYREFPIQKS